MGSWPFMLEKWCDVIFFKNKATLYLWKQVSLLLLVWVQLHALNTGSRLPRYIYLILTKEGLSFSQWLPCLTSVNYSLLGSHLLKKVQGKSKNNLDSWASVWVPTDVGFVTRFPANRWFFWRNRCISRIARFAWCNATSELSATTATRGAREKRKNKPLNVQRTFRKNCCRHCTANIVKLDWNGNAIVALISNIVASSMVIVATSISSEIPIQKLITTLF